VGWIIPREKPNLTSHIAHLTSDLQDLLRPWDFEFGNQPALCAM